MAKSGFSSRAVRWVTVAAVVLVAAGSGRGETVVFSDNFDDGDPGGRVDGALWSVVPGKVNKFPVQQLIGSPTGHQKNHTPSTDGQMGDPNIGGAAFEVDANPWVYASYHEFEPQTGVLRLSAWVWEDAERPLCTPDAWPVRGMVGLTSLPGDPTDPSGPCTGEDAIYPYGDYVFIGVESLTSGNPNDPNQKYYRWRTKADGWNLTTVPRKANYVCHGQQTWRHVEIVVSPYSSQIGDIKFYIDGALVGQGHRDPGENCRGIEFRRIQLGSRFGEASDVSICRPPFSYEHFWFDDVVLSTEPWAGSACRNADVRFDADGDGDVDQDDFSVFQQCFTGSDAPGPMPNCDLCRCMNSDGDPDIDGNDFLAFEECALGPDVVAPSGCDEGLSPP